jgi:hypothetical protein
VRTLVESKSFSDDFVVNAPQEGLLIHPSRLPATSYPPHDQPRFVSRTACLIAPLLMGLASVTLAGCARATGGGGSTPTIPAVIHSGHIPAPVDRALSQIQAEYASADWTAVRNHIGDAHLAAGLVDNMQRWSSEGAHAVHLRVVYSRRISRTRSIEAVEFMSDPRAAPYFTIFRFRAVRGRAVITGTTTGIRGSDFGNASWTVSHTPHFVVYHSPYQLVGSDRHLLRDLEYQRRQFARKFAVKLRPLAAFYLYPTQSLMGRFTGGTCGARPGEVGCTLPYTNPPSIHATLVAAYHEPIHIYELSLEPPPLSNGNAYVAPLFIGEGTAVALQERGVDPQRSDYCSDLVFRPLDDCARIAMAQVRPLKLLSDSGFKRVDPGNAYALGGSFVKYLILRYGYHAFGRFYFKLAAQPKDRILDYNVAARAVYHQPIAQLLRAWTAVLCRSRC